MIREWCSIRRYTHIDRSRRLVGGREGGDMVATEDIDIDMIVMTLFIDLPECIHQCIPTAH